MCVSWKNEYVFRMEYIWDGCVFLFFDFHSQYSHEFHANKSKWKIFLKKYFLFVHLYIQNRPEKVNERNRERVKSAHLLTIICNTTFDRFLWIDFEIHFLKFCSQHGIKRSYHITIHNFDFNFYFIQFFFFFFFLLMSYSCKRNWNEIAEKNASKLCKKEWKNRRKSNEATTMIRCDIRE